jgi:signal transduction histidine kinase
MSLTPSIAPEANRASRGHEILAAQVRLLYANANLGFGITILAAAMLGCLQWGTVPNLAVIGWGLYMAIVALSRFVLAQRFRRASAGCSTLIAAQKWRVAFAVGAGLAGAGWGAAGVLLYSGPHLLNQVFLVFVLGGMMLGAASLLAPRPETYLAFLIPTGLIPAIRLLVQGDQTHLAMGLLAVVFTMATLITTGRIYGTIDSALRLQFENRDLVEDLQIAQKETEALNQVLELRVDERTAELRKSAEQLRAEIAQRELMEEELLRARKLESLGVMAGGIAHDFNNFLTIVQGNIELAKGNLKPDELVQEMLNQAADASQRAAGLSSQLLTFAKGGAPVRRVVSIAKLVTDAVRLARTEAVMSISVNIADDVGFAEVDAGQIAQVLHNILLNARQAMGGSGLIEIRVDNVVLQRTHSADPSSGSRFGTSAMAFPPTFFRGYSTHTSLPSRVLAGSASRRAMQSSPSTAGAYP